jgi:hypothetical protein
MGKLKCPEPYCWTSVLLAAVLAMAAGCSEADKCPDPEGPYFTLLPAPADRIDSVIVLGQFNPPGDIYPRAQTGFRIVQGEEFDVVAAGDMRLGSVRAVEYLEAPGFPARSDYSVSVVLEGCQNIRLYYHHMTSLASALAEHLVDAECEEYSTESRTVRSCSAWLQDRKISLPAGTVIGRTGSDEVGLDFDAFDDRVTHSFISPHRLNSEALTAVCTTNLFVPELRTLLEARVGRAGVYRTALPICGTMEVDVPGTAQGMWLLDGEDVPIRGDTADRFFALANDDLRPDEYVVISTGHPGYHHPDVGPILYAFDKMTTGRVNRDFSHLEPDGVIYCYKPALDSPLHFPADGMSFLVALNADGKLSIDRHDHASGESPCDLAPETWELSQDALTLMR